VQYWRKQASVPRGLLPKERGMYMQNAGKSRKPLIIGIIAAVVVLAVLLALVLTQCVGGNPAATTDPNATGSTEVPTYQLYWNVDRAEYDGKSEAGMSSRMPESDGYFHVRFILDGEEVVLKVADRKLINAIDVKDLMGLEFDENGIVVNVLDLDDMPLEKLGWQFYVQSAAKKLIKLNSSESMNGMEVLLEMGDESGIYDMSGLSGPVGVTGEPINMDRVYAVANLAGEVTHVFIYQRPNYMLTHEAECQHCKKVVTWYEWTKEDQMPLTTGHYQLMNDIQLKGQPAQQEDAKVCIDLNGKRVDGAAGSRCYAMFNSGTELAIMDTSAEQTGRLAAHGKGDQGMVVWVRYGAFYLYGGTLDASDATTKLSGTAIECGKGKFFYMYGGTIIGGTAEPQKNDKGNWTNGLGGSISLGGKMVMHGGEIRDGKAPAKITKKDGQPVYNRGYGGNIYMSSSAVLEINGGVIKNGVAGNVGGNIFMDGAAELTINGGKILGGTINGKGKNGGSIFAGSKTVIVQSGGTISGGSCRNCGGNVYTNGRYTMKGGTISNGVIRDFTTGKKVENAASANVFIVNGKFYMYGGTVTGGVQAIDTSATDKNDTTVLLSGYAKINGGENCTRNLTLTTGGSGITVRVGNMLKGSMVGVYTTTGYFTLPTKEANKDHFFSDIEGAEILYHDERLALGRLQCICGKSSGDVVSDVHINGCDAEARVWAPWVSTVDVPTATGNYYLLGDVTSTAQRVVGMGKHVRLDLNGKNITYKVGQNTQDGFRLYRADYGGVLQVTDTTENPGTLKTVMPAIDAPYSGTTVKETIKDEDGKVIERIYFTYEEIQKARKAGNFGMIFWARGGKIILHNGNIDSSNLSGSHAGMTINVGDETYTDATTGEKTKYDGSFTMYNGNVKLGATTGSGNICVNSGAELYIHGGTITATAENSRSVYIKGDAVMTGGTITGAKTSGNGANVQVSDTGVFTISGGEITKGHSKDSGGNIASYGILNVAGGTIRDGISDKNQGDNIAMIRSSETYNTTLNLSGGTVAGGIQLNNYKGPVKVNVSGDPVVDKSLSNSEIKVPNYSLQGNVLFDVSGMTGGKVFVQASSYFATGANETIKGFFRSDYEDAEVLLEKGGDRLFLGGEYCVCGASKHEGAEHLKVGDAVACNGELLQWMAWRGTGSVPTTAGNYYLTNTTTTSTTVSITNGADIKLDLNGKELKSTDWARLYRLNPGHLTVTDSSKNLSGKITVLGNRKDQGILWLNDGSINWIRGTFDGTAFTLTGEDSGQWKGARTGGLIAVDAKGTFNMYSGELLGGTTGTRTGGDGVVNYGYAPTLHSAGVTNIYGGKLVGNKAVGNTANINIGGGTFTVYGGEIVGGTATGNGASIYVSKGNLIVKGGEIRDGKAYCGGNIYLAGGSFTMDGGTVSGGDIKRYNTTGIGIGGQGGNIYIGSSATAVMNGGLVTGGYTCNEANPNSTFIKWAVGANIYTSGAFTLNGGTIADGRVDGGSGANVYIDNASGSMTMNGGTITGGKAGSGGNISMANKSTLVINDGVISEGSVTGNGGNIGVSDGNVTINGGVIRDGFAKGNGTGGSGEGGNIRFGGGKLIMTGGEISGGQGLDFGGNIHVAGGTFELSGGTITGGKLNPDGTEIGDLGYGGNVCISGTFKMTGGEITNGVTKAGVSGTVGTTTYSSGGGLGGNLCIFGTGELLGGTISGGNAGVGGNLGTNSSGAKITLNGVTIKDGTATSGGNIAVNVRTCTKLDILGNTQVLNGNATTGKGGNLYINSWVDNAKNMDVNITDATISGGSAKTNGGNIYAVLTKASTKANINISNANISGGTAGTGGSVYMDTGSVLNLNSGSISGGAASNHGGNIFINNSKLVMNGGTISGGNAASNGGNITLSGASTAEILAGEISGGTAKNSGNIVVWDSSKLYVKGGEIKNGIASAAGGNILLDSNSTELHISGGTISGGKANGGTGGNITLWGKSIATMSGGTVSGGTSSANGGNINVSTKNTFTLSGGTISGGSSGDSGGNLVVYGKLIMSGGTVMNGKSKNEGNGMNIAVIKSSGDCLATLELSGGTIAGGLQFNNATDNCKVSISGKPVVDKELSTENKPTYSMKLSSNDLTIGTLTEGAKIMVSGPEGVFSYAAPEGSEKYFTSEVEGLTVWQVKGELVLVHGKEASCVCGVNSDNLDDHIGTCDGEPHFWLPVSSLPTTSGYYYLISDVTDGGHTINNGKDCDIYLDLNGKKIISNGGRMYSLFDDSGNVSMKLTITDNSANRDGLIVMSGNHDQGGLVWVRNKMHSFTMYAGTIDATAAKIPSNKALAGVVFAGKGDINLFGGTIKGGTLEGDNKYGGSAVALENSKVYYFGDVEITGLSQSAIYMADGGKIDLTNVTEKPETPWTIDASGIFTQGWNKDWNISDYFVAESIYGCDIFLDEATGELKMGILDCTCRQDPCICDGKQIIWQPHRVNDWLPTTTGNYFLTRKVSGFGQRNITSDTQQDVKIDLAGYEVTSNKGNRVYLVQKTSILTITDSVGTGVMNGGGSNNNNSGTLLMQGSTVLNLYAGKITLSSDAYTNMSRAGNIEVASNGAFNMYGGEVTGGKAQYGGNIFAEGSAKVNILGGKVTNGVASYANTTDTLSYAQGGNIFFRGSGQLNISGKAEISGGKAITTTKAGANTWAPGGNIFVSGGHVTVDGDAVIKNGTSSDGNNIYMSSASGVIDLKKCTVLNSTSGNANIVIEAGTLNVMDGAMIENTATGTRNIATNDSTYEVEENGVKVKKQHVAYINIKGGTVTGGHVTGGTNGGNIIVCASDFLTISGGVIEDGISENQAGNISVHGNITITGGIIRDGKAKTDGDGHNICVTPTPDNKSKVTISGGTIAGGLVFNCHYDTPVLKISGKPTIDKAQTSADAAVKPAFGVNIPGSFDVDVSGLTGGKICVKGNEAGQFAFNATSGMENYFVSETVLDGVTLPVCYADGGLTFGQVYCLCGYTKTGTTLTAHAAWCDKENRIWLPWTGTSALPTTTGNYYLTQNLTNVSASEMAAETANTVRLDLNGKTVTAKQDNRVYRVAKSNHLIITDTVGTAVVYGGGSAEQYGNGGVFRTADSAKVTICGGTFTLTDNATVGDRGSVIYAAGQLFTINGGKILINKNVGGGIVVTDNKTMNMTGGEIYSTAANETKMLATISLWTNANLNLSGGTIESTGKNCRNIGTEGKVTMTGGTIKGGNATITDNNGSSIHINGVDASKNRYPTFEMSGGLVTGASGTTQGGNFCVRGTLIVSGDAVIKDGKASGKDHGNITIIGSNAVLDIRGGTIAGGVLINNGAGQPTVKLSGKPVINPALASTADLKPSVGINWGDASKLIDVTGLTGGEIHIYARKVGQFATNATSGMENYFVSEYVSGDEIIPVSYKDGGLHFGATYCLCGASKTGASHEYWCDKTQHLWTPWAGVSTNTSGYYYLTAAMSQGQLEIGNTTKTDVVLDLNGKQLTASGSCVFRVMNGSLSVTNTGNKTTGKIVAKGVGTQAGALLLSNGVTINLYEGIWTLESGKSAGSNGGIVDIGTGTTVNMYGGTIAGGVAGNQGGNVSVSGGTFNFYGGTISGGTAKQGGNVRVTAGQFNMIPSPLDTKDVATRTISDGLALVNGGYGKGGNIYATGANAKVVVEGKNSIVKNGDTQSFAADGSATWAPGGNICIEGSAQVTVSNGATVKDGKNNSNGHNFYMTGGSSILTLNGAIVSNNKTGDANLYVEAGTLNIQGNTEITTVDSARNISTNQNGVAVINISGGTITGGTYDGDGANIWASSRTTLNISGGTITGGKAKGSADRSGGNIYVCGQQTRTVKENDVDVTYTYNDAVLNITGGTISNGEATYGGNIYINGKQTHNMSAGKVLGGATTGHGGNISLAAGTLNIKGGTVEGGKATVNGGAGNINISGSAVVNLSSGTVKTGFGTKQGGNFRVDSSAKLNVTGGTIQDGLSADCGGNIYANGLVTISGGTITGGKKASSPTATAEFRDNSNVYFVNGDLTATGGTIDGMAACNTVANGCIIKISGTTKITNKSGTGMNLVSWAESGKTPPAAPVVNVGTLSEGASIAVQGQLDRVFANGTGAIYENKGFFSSDNGYQVICTEEGMMMVDANAHAHCECGGTKAGDKGHTCYDVVYERVTSLTNQTAKAETRNVKYWYLDVADYDTNTWYVSYNNEVHLCLNGNSIQNNGRIISLHEKADGQVPEVVITSCEDGSRIYTKTAYADRGRGIWVRNGNASLTNVTVDVSSVTSVYNSAAADAGHNYEGLGISVGSGLTLKMHDVTVIGGMTDGKGSAMYNNGSVIMSGDIDIHTDTAGSTPALYVVEGKKLDISGVEKVAAPIKTCAYGVFTTGAKNCSVDVTKLFTSAEGVDIFVSTTAEPGELYAGKLQCLCGSNSSKAEDHLGECDGTKVEWKPWASKTSMPKSTGYYVLTSGEVKAARTTPDDGSTISIDLNGQKVSASSRFYTPIYVETAATSYYCKSATLNFMSSKSGGQIYSTVNDNQGGVFWMGDGAKVSLYNVIVDARKAQAKSTGAVADTAYGSVFNMFGSTVIYGGTTSTHGGAMAISGQLNMWDDSKIIGGIATGTTSSMGGNVYVRNTGAVLTMNDNAIIQDGLSYYNGGNVFVYYGKLIMNDNAQILNGKACNISGNIQIGSDQTLEMNGGKISGGQSYYNVSEQKSDEEANHRNVTLLNNAIFKMTGGEITGYVDAFAYSGGRYPKITISGTAKIFGGTKNLCLSVQDASQKVFSIAVGDLDSTAKIGITLDSEYVPGTVIATGVDQSELSCFVSDKAEVTFDYKGGNKEILLSE